ncbi:hypothetical protein SMGD1_2770 [Sulfurimonas gotlandica GD1]|uniref:Uncharacterized protein n=1 Tax=Sulfurimonas gotlandica (strain DSM 19862 / JCM 16533 / GD1) TaxID=929558 RepID=H1FTI3_SULGG|nr:hypothetical protein [Sulfurimonas gotlandica]EHP31292.1 hypothetical protein SMGD1_2770 [Sulfurimonas gotlandica GD1]
MKKLIFLSLIFVNMLYGYSYNDILLKAQASIFPKIMLLDKNIENKLVDGKIVYTIAYDKSDISIAQEISKFINKNFDGYFDKYLYQINLVEFSDLSSDTKASAIYTLNSDEHIDKVANIAREKGVIAFSYDIENLKKGLLFSMMLEKSTVLYLNKEDLNKTKIDFVDSLLQMVRFIDKNDL